MWRRRRLGRPVRDKGRPVHVHVHVVRGAARFVMRYRMHYTARRIVRPVIRGGGGGGGGTSLSLVRSVQKPGAPRDWTTLTSPDHTPVLPSRANVDTLAPPITGSSTVSQVRVLDADLDSQASESRLLVAPQRGSRAGLRP